jgi:putative Holliday junction resolvase
MGLDVGEKRIGIAVGETEIGIATPYDAIERQGPVNDDVFTVIEIAEKQGVGKLVVGLPLTLSGREASQARSVRRFVEGIRAQTNLRVLTVDERYSTVDAERRMRDVGEKPSLNRGRVDSVAAAIILQAYFDSNLK